MEKETRRANEFFSVHGALVVKWNTCSICSHKSSAASRSGRSAKEAGNCTLCYFPQLGLLRASHFPALCFLWHAAYIYTLWGEKTYVHHANSEQTLKVEMCTWKCHAGVSTGGWNEIFIQLGSSRGVFFTCLSQLPLFSVLYYITQPSRFQLSCCTFARAVCKHTQVAPQWISGEHTRRITCFPSAPVQKCAQISLAAAGVDGAGDLRPFYSAYLLSLARYTRLLRIHGFCLLCARSISCSTRADEKKPARKSLLGKANLWIMDVAAGGWKKYRCMQNSSSLVTFYASWVLCGLG